MRQRGGFNRRTGKTTPRNKGKTHWGGKAPVGRSRKAATRATAGAKP